LSEAFCLSSRPSLPQAGYRFFTGDVEKAPDPKDLEMAMIETSFVSAQKMPERHKADDSALRDAAQKLEASFLAEMLEAAGVGEQIEGWGGGVGEDQFASFLRHAQAEEMSKHGGIGLAESLFNALKERSDA
jgi:peptidoglycan hydrolase FlgJ